MHFHEPLSEKSLAAGFADPVLGAILLVDLLVVSFEITVTGQLSVAKFTFERSLPCVGDLVFLHGRLDSECLRSYGTLELLSLPF